MGAWLEEAPTRIDGKVRVFGEPIAPRHPDGPGPSLESVLVSYVDD